MNIRYSIRREPEALALPFGAGGVAAAGALALALVGLLVPIAWLETIAFQLYLDTVIPAAAPPLGTTARIVAALVLALFGALLGFALARAFGVVAADVSFADLIARLRGPGAEDERDAPDLRAADRHPDAPARRPFSATRDLPADARVPLAAQPFAGFDDEAEDDFGDELVLDAQFTEVTEVTKPTPAPFPADVPPLNEAPELIEAYDLRPPDPADWERSSPIADRFRAARAADLDESEPAMPPADPAPGGADPAPVTDEAATGTTEPAPAPVDDPAFPHDPALAAALATLRKMAARAG